MCYSESCGWSSWFVPWRGRQSRTKISIPRLEFPGFPDIARQALMSVRDKSRRGRKELPRDLQNRVVASKQPREIALYVAASGSCRRGSPKTEYPWHDGKSGLSVQALPCCWCS